MIICVIGRVGSGKTFISHLIVKNWLPDSPIIEVSSIVGRIAGVKKDGNRDKLINEINKHRDPDWLFKEIKSDIDVVKNTQPLIISGLREPYLLYRLMDTYREKFLIIKLVEDDWTRYIRLCRRESFVSVEDFRKADEGDNKLGLDILMNLSTTVAELDILEIKSKSWDLREIENVLELKFAGLGIYKRKLQ